MVDDTAISLRDVSFAYGRQPVLTRVDVTIKQGEFTTIVGPNGGGKTTLLKLILGRIRPDTGTIRVLGTTPEKACLRVGYMPQHAHLDPRFPVTVMDVVLMGRLGGNRPGFYTKADRQNALKALSYTGMADMAGRHLSQLSGGQRQRVLIARALSTEPELLLLDEPTSNIDPGSESALFEILQTLNKTMTILIVSHDLGFVSRHVNRVICVNRSLVVHPTSAVNGMVISKMYGQDMCMVRHDHQWSPGSQVSEKISFPNGEETKNG
ncbi:MAG: metal ABC transporter ATP-binding protein [Thermodesulfobacteriota bacterium]|nr:metal ABC transporter ATP-binding protein [Thermodesulfobacteriota bacterium]